MVVQVRRDADGFRRVSEIWEPKTDRRVLAGGADFGRRTTTIRKGKPAMWMMHVWPIR